MYMNHNLISKYSIYYLLPFLLIIAICNLVHGQSKSGHFKYGLISHEILDSQNVSGTDIVDVSTYIDHLHSDLYYNTDWVVVLSTKKDAVTKSMFNRKSNVLYTFYHDSIRKRLRIDSIYRYYIEDPALLAARDTLKELMGITISPEDVSIINGFTCHKEYYREEFSDGSTVDEIRVTLFLKTPNLIFNDHMYFLNGGIPVRIVEDFIDFKITWGIVEILPLSKNDQVFDFDPSEYSSETFDSKNMINEFI